MNPCHVDMNPRTAVQPRMHTDAHRYSRSIADRSVHPPGYRRRLRFHPCPPARDSSEEVAQSCTLLYRRIAFGSAHETSKPSLVGETPCRLQTCDTAEFNSALRVRSKSVVSAGSLLVIATFVLSLQTLTANPFDQANQGYAAGHYTEAAHGFEQVIAQQGYSAPVLFNLGNAWLKAGEPGRAILNYERAQVLAPQDHAIARNLQSARKQAGVVVPEPGTLEQVARTLSWNALTWIGVAALLLACVSIFITRFRPSLPRTGLRFLIASGACALIMTAAALVVRWPELDRAIVLVPDTPARIAPADAAAVSFKLPGGGMVYARQTHGGFVLVRTDDGRSGWVNKNQVAKVLTLEREAPAEMPKAATRTDDA